MTAAIYYHPEAYTTSGPKLMGRNAAGESFLRGFLKHSKAFEFWAQVQKPEHGQHFAQTVKAQGRNEVVKVVDKSTLSALQNIGTVYFPGPGIGEHAFHRALAGSLGASARNPHTAWSLCGITHTTSSAGAMDALAELITAPVQPWDAVICTSTAVKNNVQRILQAQVNYLQDKMGISKLVLPTDAEIAQVLNAAAQGPTSAQALVQGIEPSRQAFFLRSLAWLLKLGVLRLS